MVSVVDAAKRELVKLLRSLALVYSVVLKHASPSGKLFCFVLRFLY